MGPLPTLFSQGKRFYSFGALYDGGFHCRFYEKATGRNFVDYLKQLRKKFGKVLVFVDNAGYHKSSYVQNEVKKMEGDVVLRYFPAYTPELNPTEMQWRDMRLHTANRLYESSGEMKNAIKTMLRTGEITIAKMSYYLM